MSDKTKQILAAFLWAAIVAFTGFLVGRSCHGEQTYYRDRSGRIIGSSTSSTNQTTFRDSSGRYAGNATINGKATTYRDSGGRIIIQQSGSGSSGPVPYFYFRGRSWRK